LEDIIGSAKYVPLIEAKEVEVEKLNDSRGEVLNRVKVIIDDMINPRLLKKNEILWK
jgi:singapore isolate B (sub-type 7) whole genome shotgun sequence assembly, scaffold_4